MKTMFRAVKNTPHALYGFGAQGLLCTGAGLLMPRNGVSVLATGLLGLAVFLVLAIGAWLVQDAPEVLQGEIVGLRKLPELPDAQVHTQRARELPKAA